MAYMIRTVVTRPTTETAWFGAVSGNGTKAKAAIRAVRRQAGVVAYYQRRINATKVQRTLIATTQALAEAALAAAASEANFAERATYETSNSFVAVSTSAVV